MACSIKTATQMYRDLCQSHHVQQMKTSEVRVQGNYGRTALLSKLAVPTAANEGEKLECCPVSQQSIACVCCATINSSSNTTKHQRFDAWPQCDLVPKTVRTVINVLVLHMYSPHVLA